MYAPCCGKLVPNVVQNDMGIKDIAWNCPKCKARHRVSATRISTSGEGHNLCRSRTITFTKVGDR